MRSAVQFVQYVPNNTKYTTPTSKPNSIFLTCRYVTCWSDWLILDVLSANAKKLKKKIFVLHRL